MKEIRETILGSDDEQIQLKYLIPETIKSPYPILLIHGFKGFMDWGHFPYAMKMMAEKGNVVISINFSHDGTSPDAPEDFSRLDLFAKNTYSKELFDIVKVLDEIENSERLKSLGINTKKVNLIGHSRGGGDVIITAYEDKRIHRLVTWASVNRLATYFADDDDVLQDWKANGVVYIYNSRTEQDMPMNYTLYEDTIKNKERFDVKKAAENLSVPWLIIHGDKDPTVSVGVAKSLHALQATSELFIMHDAHHNFGGKHPLDDTADFEQINLLIEKTTEFLMR